MSGVGVMRVESTFGFGGLSFGFGSLISLYVGKKNKNKNCKVILNKVYYKIKSGI
jgi:hypothetical protein